MLRVGIIGWRGMVGSVLLQRMHEENDFDKIDTYFFSTSQAGEKVHVLKSQESTLHNALDVHELKEMDILLSSFNFVVKYIFFSSGSVAISNFLVMCILYLLRSVIS